MNKGTGRSAPLTLLVLAALLICTGSLALGREVGARVTSTTHYVTLSGSVFSPSGSTGQQVTRVQAQATGALGTPVPHRTSAPPKTLPPVAAVPVSTPEASSSQAAPGSAAIVAKCQISTSNAAGSSAPLSAQAVGQGTESDQAVNGSRTCVVKTSSGDGQNSVQMTSSTSGGDGTITNSLSVPSAASSQG